jgi:hypothetical protein
MSGLLCRLGWHKWTFAGTDPPLLLYTRGGWVSSYRWRWRCQSCGREGA